MPDPDHLPPCPPRGPVHCPVPGCGEECYREKHPAEPDVGVEAFDGWCCTTCGWQLDERDEQMNHAEWFKLAMAPTRCAAEKFERTAT